MVSATWWAASGTSPSEAATHVVTSSVARRASVRTSRGMPVRAAARTRAGCGRSRACRARALTSSTVTSAMPMPVCAMTVPHADPAMPQCNP